MAGSGMIVRCVQQSALLTKAEWCAAKIEEAEWCEAKIEEAEWCAAKIEEAGLPFHMYMETETDKWNISFHTCKTLYTTYLR